MIVLAIAKSVTCQSETGMWRRNEDARNVKGCGEGMREPAACQENPGSANSGWRGPSGRQESLEVPEMAGGNPPRARNPWQCQKWLAGTCPAPIIPGSANPGWRRSSGRQESLAVPEMAGGNPPRARKPWQCQSWVASTRRMPENPGSANPGWKVVTRDQTMWVIGCVRFPTRKRARRRAGS